MSSAFRQNIIVAKGIGCHLSTCSDLKRIRTRNARSINRSDVDTWGFSSSIAWQSFEVVPNVIGPTWTNCERVVHHPAVVHYFVFSVFPSIIYNKCSLPALRHNYSLPASLPASLPPSLPEGTYQSPNPSNIVFVSSSSAWVIIFIPSRLQDSFTAHRPVAATRANSAPFTY